MQAGRGPNLRLHAVRTKIGNDVAKVEESFSFDLLGLPLEPRDGMSLFFDAPERLVFALTDYGPGQIGLRDKRFTYILFRNGKELFFDRDADPAELTNVLDRFPEDVARFRARLQPKK